MKKILALALPLLLSAWSAQASLIWYEGFNYSNGNITNVSANVWTNFSGNGLHDMLVSGHTLQVSATSSTTVLPDRADDDARMIATVPNSPLTNTVQLVYASFTFICTNLPNGAGSYFASFYNTAFGYCGRVQAFTNGTTAPNTFRLGVTDGVSATNLSDGGFPVDLATNTPYQVVLEIDPLNLQAATLWVNPISINNMGGAPIDPDYTAKDSLTFQLTNQVNSFAFRQASSFGSSFFIVTNLALATTFAEAFTNVVGTNAVAPSIVNNPLPVNNFVGNPISLSGVANGQGLGSLTYQWQQNGVNYTGGSGATTPILSISSAQPSDNGSFTLIATTPYGLSVTSAPVTVSISSAAVPPQFVTQPSSQLDYRGQSATFNVSVISPDIGTVFYQWKTNGVSVPGANSTSFTLNNLTTNLNGLLVSVGVTNDVTPTGVLSSNAVLTVLNPVAATVAYIRTLVNPANAYAPTNLTIPYEVTGIVTTFTNLTSGNTASYYLQDATAGINIFVTFGSTFRPAQGDVLDYVGTLSSFTSGLELVVDQVDNPYTSLTTLSNNIAGLPAPITIPFTVTNAPNLPFVNTNLAGSLVELHGCFFGTNTGKALSSTANVIAQVTNSAGLKFQVEFYDLDQDTVGKVLPAFATSISGALTGINTNFQVSVTRWSDVVTSAPALTLAPSGGNIGFTWPDPSFFLQASTNVTGPYVTIPGAPNTGFTTNAAGTNAMMFYRLYHP